jgi:hypothetical protein
VYARHAGLFSAGAVEELRALTSAPADADELRARRMLLQFAVDGHMGLATKELEAELARREVELTLEVDGEAIGFRESSVVLANEPDAARRAAIEAARIAATESEINPIAGEMLERVHALAGELGWPSYRAMCEALKGIDLDALRGQTRAFLRATDDRYEPLVDPELRRTLGFGLAELRRSDLARFFRVAEADALFPEERLVESFRGGLASHNRAQRLVLLRRYCAKLDYELELHGGEHPVKDLPGRYAGALSEAVRVEWPAAMWLTDVDPAFYVANYLRAWALETHVRALLRERFGETWFEQPEAGATLIELWRDGQRRSAEEIATGLGVEVLSFEAVLADLTLA